MTGAVRLEILSSLASVRDDVERQVAKLERYRALQAIERTIVEFPGLEEVNRALSDLRDSMQRKLGETREVRALQAIEKIMPDLSDVLAFLSERSEEDLAASEQAAQGFEAEVAPDCEPAAAIGRMPEIEEAEAEPDVAAVEIGEWSDPQYARAGWQQDLPPQQPAPARIAERADSGDAPPHANDPGISGDEASPPQATISYGIAQFLNLDEPVERPAIAEKRHDDDGPPQRIGPSSHEGRAA